MKWYYRTSNGSAVGPIDPSDLKRLAAAGVITPFTKVETETGKQGLARDVKGLFDEPQVSVPAPQIPAPEDTEQPTQNETENPTKSKEEQWIDKLNKRMNESISVESPSFLGFLFPFWGTYFFQSRLLKAQNTTNELLMLILQELQKETNGQLNRDLP